MMASPGRASLFYSLVDIVLIYPPNISQSLFLSIEKKG